MKAQIVSAALVAGIAVTGSAHAADAVHVWQGPLLVTDASAQCANSSNVGDVLTLVYRPIIPSGDTSTPSPPPEAVSVTSAHSSSLYTSTMTGGSLQGAAKFAGDRINGLAQFDTFTGTSHLKVVPSALAATGTPLVTVSGYISNWFNHPSCKITFTASLEQVQ